MRVFTLLLSASLALTGCKRNEERFIRSVVSSVGAATILQDAATLAAQSPPKDGLPQTVTSLPASFQAFAPIQTRRYDQQFLIVTYRYFQHLVGVVVQPLNYPEPEGIGGSRYIRIAPGIYYYES